MPSRPCPASRPDGAFLRPTDESRRPAPFAVVLYNSSFIFQCGENKISPLFFLIFGISRTVTTFFLLFTKNSYTPHNPSLFFWYKISELPASCIQSKNRAFRPLCRNFTCQPRKHRNTSGQDTRNMLYLLCPQFGRRREGSQPAQAGRINAVKAAGFRPARRRKGIV